MAGASDWLLWGAAVAQSTVVLLDDQATRPFSQTPQTVAPADVGAWGGAREALAEFLRPTLETAGKTTGEAAGQRVGVFVLVGAGVLALILLTR